MAAGRLKGLWGEYGDRVQFLVVYIREAHALDGRAPIKSSGTLLVEEPRTLEERNSVAVVCMTKMQLEGIPAVVDGMDNAVNRAYMAGPDRLYLVGRDGNIAYRGGRGPWGFLPDELGDAIKKELAKLEAEAPDAPRP